jgi:Mg-chelatase subunit ChlD
MRFANPAGWALLALAIPVLLAHVLRPRRTPLTVSSILLWKRLERPVSAAQPWQRLRWSLLLVAQLLAVALLAAAVAHPERLEASTLAEHTVFIVDASGSMAATDGSPDRLAAARARAVDLQDELPPGGVASIVVAGTTARVALTASADDDEFEQALRTIDGTEGRADFADAFALAQSLETGTTPIGFVLLTAGGLTGEEAALLPAGTTIERVGRDATNRGIARLSVEPRDGALHARVAVRNHGSSAVTQTLRIDVDGATGAATEVTLEAGEQRDVELDVPNGEHVEAFLEGGDLLAADDHAVAVVGGRRALDVLIVGDPLFWGEALTAMPGVTVDVTDGSVPPPTDGYDLVVYNAVAVPVAPTTPFIAVAPPGGVPAGAGEPGVAVVGVADAPAVTLVRADDALLGGLVLSDVAIATAQRVEAGEAEVLVAAEGAPLLLRGRLGGEPFAYLTFGLRDSNLAVQLAFPLLTDRLVGELTGATSITEPVEVGQRLPVPAGGATVTGPDAEVRTVAAGDPAPVASRRGYWTVEPAGDDVPPSVVAVNPPSAESAIAPADVAAPAARATGGDEPPRRATSLLPWVLWPLLALLAVELLLAWRRVGVSRRQWRLAVGVRVAVAALIVLALADPVLRRPSDRVASVFVVDASASVTGPGEAAATAFLDAAAGARPDDSAAGIVVFGGDARVDQVVDRLDAYTGSQTVVDPSATDIAGGLRLGAALLPSDARRRIVLVSDGRATNGDLAAEVERLRADGVPVDVVTLDSLSGPDAAVAGLDVPRLARVGDAVEVTVNVVASVGGTATVALRRDGVDVGAQTVTLVAGTNAVTFRDEAGADAGAVLRYQAVVSAPGDSIAENDAGFAAVPVEGPARVLVIEGAPGEATTLVEALTAGGVGTQVVGVGDVPTVQELITYAGIVLVDVDARTLSGAQIETLTTAVRDLGRGLLTIGGRQSYGVGGYRESPLSDLLPVDSEILDPQRRKTVAEVLSIDTSESMSACHCREDQTMTIEQGGVNKTDISRAAAERTISALAATDEVGVLAWNSSADWVIPLQQLPPADVVDRGLRSLQPFGQTDIRDSLRDAAEALIASDAELKHIILFTDGFTDQRLIADTADEAGRLLAEHGITTSVLATGEGAAPLLEDIAIAGNGRFYAGTDLAEIPQIMAEEAVTASRNFVTEGEFLPEVVSDDDVVAALTASPPLLGYVATTAKGQATTLLRIGPDRDPLLASWQAGLGRVSSWTSDVTNWSAGWSSWDGFVGFWSTVVKDTLPAGDDAGAVQAAVRDGRIVVSVEDAEAFPDGSVATAHVSGPDGQSIDVALERTGADRFEGAAEAPRPGTYAVGATVTGSDGGPILSSSTLASNSYPAEYVPGTADAAALARIAAATGGRAEIAPADVWDRDGLPAGHRLLRLLPWLLLAAALLWPLAVLISRISVRGATLAGAVAGSRAAVRRTGRRVRVSRPTVGGLDPGDAPAPRRAPPADLPPPPPPRPSSPPPADTAQEPEEPQPDRAPAPSTLDELLSRKRERRS